MYFFDNNEFIKNCVLHALSKRLPPRAAKIKPVLFIELGKKTTAFQPSSKFIVFKKDTVGNGFFVYCQQQ